MENLFGLPKISKSVRKPLSAEDIKVIRSRIYKMIRELQEAHKKTANSKLKFGVK